LLLNIGATQNQSQHRHNAKTIRTVLRPTRIFFTVTASVCRCISRFHNKAILEELQAMEIEYCWRVGEELPMLNEEEWAQLSSLLSDTVSKIKAYRAEYCFDLPTASSEL
jgi:hypothetical protein